MHDKFGKIMIIIAFLLGAAVYAQSEEKYSFNDSALGTQPDGFLYLAGHWLVDLDQGNLVFAVDGRNWAPGAVASSEVAKAKNLYGKNYAVFLDNIDAYKYFPLSICQKCNELENGKIQVSFKAISGKIDQAAGIAFGIQPNGDYYVIRANGLENNFVLFQVEGGVRKKLLWIDNVSIKAGEWNLLEVEIANNQVLGSLNGKLLIEHTVEAPGGRVGLWSKADSYVLFDDFVVNYK